MGSNNVSKKNFKDYHEEFKKKNRASYMRKSYASKKNNNSDYLRIVNPTKTTTKTYSTYSKEKLRTYMENPLKNYNKLREISVYLYYRSQPYRRLIHYYAGMIDLNFRYVLPNTDLTKGFDEKKDMASYYETLELLDKIPLNNEFFKMSVISWREDAAFGCAYFDDENGDMFILPLPAKYCVITGIYNDGTLAFDFDMSYFQNRKETLELWGEPFVSMYRAYEKDKVNGKYQPMPDDYAVVLKINMDYPEDILMPFMGIFDSLISLEDLIDLSAVADQQEIYKMLAFKMPLNKTDRTDDFAVDPNTAIAYYNRIIEDLPDYANAVLLPGLELDEISFDSNKINDVTKVENATKAIFNSAGGGQVLHNVNISGSTGLDLAMKMDETYALKPLLGQIEGIVNRLLSFRLSNPARVKFMEVSKYTKEERKDSIIKGMNYGTPDVMMFGVLNGYSEKDIILMSYVNKALNIEEIFKPLATASTRSAEEATPGRPKSSSSEITEDGEKSREKQETAG